MSSTHTAHLGLAGVDGQCRINARLSCFVLVNGDQIHGLQGVVERVAGIQLDRPRKVLSRRRIFVLHLAQEQRVVAVSYWQILDGNHSGPVRRREGIIHLERLAICGASNVIAGLMAAQAYAALVVLDVNMW